MPKIRDWRHRLRNFSPSWFSTTMGTGIVALLFVTLPYNRPSPSNPHPTPWLHHLSIVFFALNTLLFGLCFAASFLRYALWPEIWSVMVQDANNSLFLGTAPMGFATLVEMWVFVCVPVWGEWSRWAAFGAWVVDCVGAVAVTVGLGVLL